MEERVFEIAEPVRDLVQHIQPRLAQQVGLPEHEHGPADTVFDLLTFFRRQSRLFAARHQLGDGDLPVHHAAAADLRRMGGKNGADLGFVQERGDVGRRVTGGKDALQGTGDGAAPRCRAADLVMTVAPDVVVVFGDVGQMGEIAEGADHLHHLSRIQRGEDFLQGLSGGQIVVTVELDRGAADGFDQIENLTSLLGLDGVPEQTPEPTDVHLYGFVLVDGVVVDRSVFEIHRRPI